MSDLSINNVTNNAYSTIVNEGRLISESYDEDGNVISEIIEYDEDNDGEIDKTLSLSYQYGEIETSDNLSDEEETTDLEFLSDCSETIQNKIRYDENGNAYIVREEYSEDSSSDHLDTLGKIVYNIYGVNFWSDEGQEIFKKLAEENPDAIDINNPDTILSDKIILINPNDEEENEENQTTTGILSMTAELVEYEEDEKGNEITKTTTDSYENDGDGLNLVKELVIERNKKGAVVNIECEDTDSNAITDGISVVDNVINRTGYTYSSLKTNGEIESTTQGRGGNCYMLSVINALSYSEKGAEIIKNALDYQDGYTIVHLKDSDVYVTNSEVIAWHTNSLSSSGDYDMNVLELAFEKYYQDKNAASEENEDSYVYASTNGGFASDILECITGNRVISKNVIDDEFLDRLESGDEDIVLVASIMSDATDLTFSNYSSNTKSSITLDTNHTYALKSVDDDYVILTNPWDSGTEIKITREEFLEKFSQFAYTKLSTD